MATIAVTLRLVQVHGLAPLAGAGASTLPRLSVAAAAHSASPAAGAVTLQHVVAAAGAVKANVATGVVTLPRLLPSLTAKIGSDNTITSIHPVLKALTVSASGVHQSLVGAVVLKRLVVAGAMHNGLAGTGSIHVTLKRILPGLYAVNKYVDLVYQVRCITGPIYANGTGIFQFRGRANLGLSWTIVTGSGSITPLGPPYTDNSGIAFAKYDAGGYNGPLTVEASYVP